MSTEIPDPTGELKRQHRRLRISRTGDRINGMIELVLGVVGIVFFLSLLGYLLWNHSTDWFRYSLSVFTLVFCASLIWLGRLSVQMGRRPITSAELTHAKQAYRRELHQAAQGNVPVPFSKRFRLHYLIMIILFGAGSGYGWYLVATAGPTSSALGLLIPAMVILLFYLYRFLVTFTGKIYQRESTTELRHILQASEFADDNESRKS